MTRIATLVAAVALGALVLAATATPATPTRLTGTVGPGFTITLTKAGKRVTALKPGSYAITVNDRSTSHNFRLKGPGVNKATTVAFKGTPRKAWVVTLRRGTYTYVCDPHADSMKGSVRVR